MKADRRSRQGRILLAGALLAVPLLLGQGCPTFVGGTGAPVVVIHAPTLARPVPIGESITLVYDATSPGGGTILVTAFYDRDGIAGTGDEVLFGPSLAGGTNQYVQLPTTGLTAGPLYVGITATNGMGTTTVYAVGMVTLGAGPSVTFSSPAGAIRVGAGTPVPVRIETHLTEYSYRVFYDRDGVLDGDETTIAEGLGSGASTIETTFDTTGLSAETYHVGATVTASTGSGSSASAYASGTVTLVAGPWIYLKSPRNGLLVTPGDFVQIIIAANDPDQPTARVRVFYDPDQILGNGNDGFIQEISQTEGGCTWDTRDVPDGDYYIGAKLQNGLTIPLYDYSVDPVTLGAGTGDKEGADGNAFLNVTTPLVPSTVLEGAVFRINWNTSLQPSEGTVTVFADRDLDDDGEPDADEATRVTIVKGLDASIRHVDWDTSGYAGKFFVGATLTESLTGVTTTDYAPGTLTVIPKIFWVGDLGTKRDDTGAVALQTGSFQGAVFRGHNFGDNLGSAMIQADDYDGDNRNEIVLAAQFGKPFLFRSGGRGAGEAYMIYGAGRRYEGDYNVNTVGQASLPGVIFSGIVPNPYAGDDPANEDWARAGNSIPYDVEGNVAGPFETEGLRSILLIPDQDNDGKQEMVFSVPYCNSYSLRNQLASGTHPAPLPALGRLENNGHFLRGGVVIVSSTNPLLANRTELSRHFDRVMQLHEVGQVFSRMTAGLPPGNLSIPTFLDFCPVTGCPGAKNKGNDVDDAAYVLNEGFYQDTQGLLYSIDAPRLADPQPAWGYMVPHGDTISMDQLDPPGLVGDVDTLGGRWFSCTPSEFDADGNPVEPFGAWPMFGYIRVLRTGFYYDELPDLGEPNCPDPFLLGAGEAYSTYCPKNSSVRFSEPLPPYGCRILGQTTSQCPSPPNCISTANRFGHSVALSGNSLLIGAPLRTVTRGDVPTLPTGDRQESGEIYMLSLKRPGMSAEDFQWSLPGQTWSLSIPHPHNFIIEDAGYNRCCYCPWGDVPGDVRYEMQHPLHIVGGAAGDRIGDVTGLYDISNDGVDDFAVGGPAVRLAGEGSPRGAVYVIYRRQSEIESDYLLEDLARDPNTDPQRLNGLMIVGKEGENIGRSLAGGGPLNDDYNNDGHADLLIGSPDATTAGGFQSGEVFILFGGRNLLNPLGGITIAELRAAGDGMLLTGVNVRDHAGMTVANAGDFNSDNVPDILIAAPDASPSFPFDSDGDGVDDAFGLDLDGDGTADDLNQDGAPDDLTGAGVVYVVFGGEHLTGTISLRLIGTEHLPGVTIVGRKAGDALGGGLTQNGLLSRGIAPAGDLDGDGRADLLVSSILADPEGKTDAGEVYLIYGFRP